MEKQIRLSKDLDKNISQLKQNVRENLRKNLEKAAEALNAECINDNTLIHAKYYEELKANCDMLENIQMKIEEN